MVPTEFAERPSFKPMNLEEQLRDRFLLQGIATGPATIEQIDRLEELIGHALPTSYRAYLRVCGTSPPKHLIGSDCTIGLVPGNNEAAIEIMSENEIAIPKYPMVTFFMHQGYYFEYFLIDGSDDPTVFSYMEGDKNVNVSADRFTQWVAEIPGHIQT